MMTEKKLKPKNEDCTLNSMIYYDSETKARICRACQDSDLTTCELGLKFICEKEKDNENTMEAKLKLIEALKLQQRERQQRNQDEPAETILEKLETVSETLTTMKSTLNEVERRAEQLGKRSKNLEKARLH